MEVKAEQLILESFIRTEPQLVKSFIQEASDQELENILLNLKNKINLKKFLNWLSIQNLSSLIYLKKIKLTKLIVSYLQSEKLILLLYRLPQDFRDSILLSITPKKRTEIMQEMIFPENTVGSLIEKSVPVFQVNQNVGYILKLIRTKKYDYFQHIILLNDSNQFVGMVELSKVFVASLETEISELIEQKTPTVYAMSTKDDLKIITMEYYLPILPVVNHENHFLGIIRTESILCNLQEASLANIQSMVGVSPDEQALSSPFFAIKKRLLWLNINLLTAFLAAGVVAIFEKTISEFTALAILLPIVAGQAGNTGAQSQAVVLRGIALKEIRLSQYVKVFFKEMIVGFVNGIAIGLVTAIAVYFWSGSLGLSMIMIVSMVLALSVASIAGALVPIVLKWVKQDPAQSSSIILTTITDCSGFFLFLGFASLFSKFLL